MSKVERADRGGVRVLTLADPPAKTYSYELMQ